MALLQPTDRDQLIKDNLGYVRALAKQIKHDLSVKLEMDELIAYGNRGLVEAAERFDPSRGVAFSTFSYYRIRGAIYDGLREIGWLTRYDYARFCDKANEYLRQQADSEGGEGLSTPPAEETLSKIEETLNNLTTIFITSLDDKTRDTHIDPEHIQVDDRLGEEQEAAVVRQALSKLPAKEREFLEMYYFGDLTLQEAGAKLGLSKSWACRLHVKAISLLSKEIKKEHPGGLTNRG